MLSSGKKQKNSTNSNANHSNLVIKILLFVLVIQWIVISFLVNREWHHHQSTSTTSQTIPFEDTSSINTAPLPNSTTITTTTITNNKMFKGVATTIFLNSPKWFQRRYTNMISNIFTNIPNDWAIQIFHSPTSEQSKLSFTYNPGIKELQLKYPNRIIFTEIPKEILKKYGLKRKKYYWTSKWIWENIIADQVFIFSGNGALCTNSKNNNTFAYLNTNIFQNVDYIGTPWYSHNGIGGSSSIFSYRNKKAMLDVIEFQPYHTLKNEPSDDDYVISTMIKINNEKNKYPFKRIATKEQTQLFTINEHKYNTDLSIEQIESIGPPFLIAGTLAKLDDERRGLLLEICPEIKMIFPVLHNPNCFGAKPNGGECAKSICALKDPSERKSGC